MNHKLVVLSHAPRGCHRPPRGAHRRLVAAGWLLGSPPVPLAPLTASTAAQFEERLHRIFNTLYTALCTQSALCDTRTEQRGSVTWPLPGLRSFL